MAASLRLAKAGHFSPIHTLFHRALTPMAERMGIQIPQDAYDWLPDCIEARNLYILEDENGVLLGATALREQEDCLYVDTFAVHPEKQNQGYGQQMLKELELVAESREVPYLRLHTPEIMGELLCFYSAHGFEETHRALPAHGRDKFLRVHFQKAIAENGLSMDPEHEHDRDLPCKDILG